MGAGHPLQGLPEVPCEAEPVFLAFCSPWVWGVSRSLTGPSLGSSVFLTTTRAVSADGQARGVRSLRRDPPRRPCLPAPPGAASGAWSAAGCVFLPSPVPGWPHDPSPSLRQQQPSSRERPPDLLLGPGAQTPPPLDFKVSTQLSSLNPCLKS